MGPRAKRLQEEPAVGEHIINWVGMDVHAESIKVAVYRGGERTPSEEWESGTERKSLERLAKRLLGLGGEVRSVYEAGPCGYGLQRFLGGKGIVCEVAAPSLIPRKPGEKVKTDRLDARKLGRENRSGGLTMVNAPDEGREAARDLVRAREDAVEDVRRARQRLGGFLLRQGRLYAGGGPWTEGHRRWLKGLVFEREAHRVTVEEYLLAVERAEEQLARLTKAVQELAETAEYKAAACALTALRGVRTVTAMTLLTEFGDMRRYGKAKEFMGALGLVPSENSTGDRIRRGPLTKTGNRHARRVLVEAAWHYQHRATAGKGIKARREGQPPEVVSAAERADVRLHRKFRRLAERGRRTTVAAAAVARELAGFAWAIGRMVHL